MSKKETEKSEKAEMITISAPNFKTGVVWIRGTAPLVIHKFSEKARRMIRQKQEAGSTAKNSKNKAAKDFTDCFNQARHISFDGWDGIPASAFRNACIDAVSLVKGCTKVDTRKSLFFEADGFDNTEGKPLVKIYGQKPIQFEDMVRLATGVCDISVRPQWLEWGARLRFRYDADQLTANSVVNLIARAGMQVGICEGRPGSKRSNGCGWGTFELSDEATVRALEGGSK